MSSNNLTAAELFRWQEAGCRLSASPSPFYAELFRRFALDADADDHATITGILARAPLTLEAAAPLRLMAGVHRGVLEGKLATVAAAWPSDGKLGDAAAAHRALNDVFVDPPDVLNDALSRDPQTNEVGRSAALAAGLNEIAARTALPLRLFEIGSSAGLNLRCDRYTFRAAGPNGACAWGDPVAGVQFLEDAYPNGAPFVGAAAVIVDRRGCDINPIDAGRSESATRLLSYVWPDQPLRLQRLRAALEIAARVPVDIDQASADDWIEMHVRPVVGNTTVLMHSIMWQYMPKSVQQRVRDLLEHRGATATAAAPLAWLRLEPAPPGLEAELRLTVWPNGERQVLATSGFHGPPVTWATNSPPLA